jgi:hypothetical protein
MLTFVAQGLDLAENRIGALPLINERDLHWITISISLGSRPNAHKCGIPAMT